MSSEYAQMQPFLERRASHMCMLTPSLEATMCMLTPNMESTSLQARMVSSLSSGTGAKVCIDA